MLIKVQTALNAESYFLVDRVQTVKYEANPREFKSLNELSEYLQLMSQVGSARIILDPRMAGMVFPIQTGDARLEEFVGQLSDKRTYRVNTLTYERDGEFRSLVFDTVAYVCTDEGKTLERAFAGGPLNY